MRWSWVVSAGWPFAPRSVYSASSTPKMLAFGSCSPSASVRRVPEQPVAEVCGWPWLSCPTMKLTLTLEQSMVPSSGSVTVTSNGIASPKSWIAPSRGSLRATVGAVLPTVTRTEAVPDLPVESVTFSVAVYCPLVR